jgi:hypothetical protein
MGIVSKRFKKYLETMPGKHSTDSLQKIAILGTSHLSGGVHHWLKRRSTREKKTCDKRTTIMINGIIL